MDFHPVTPDRWNDLVHLFEHHGNPGYCWCMYWRLSSSQYDKSGSSTRKNAMKEIVASGAHVGILAYLDAVPVAWCSVAPRGTYQRLERSTTIKRIDDQITWSIVCFYLDRSVRRQHVALELLHAAVEYARSQGAQVVEAYPVEPRLDSEGNPDYKVTYRFMGYLSTYLKAGFEDVTPPGATRKIVRYVFSDKE
ncbi:MAG: GNAT family N-acetyltransferase [Anaerolineales bacterium]